MISWKVTRIACILLLLMPIVHLIYLMSRDSVESLDNSPEAWAREVDAYAEADALVALPPHPVLVVGGRRVKLWHDLGSLLTPWPVIIRSLGDAIVEDISFNYDRLIGFYQPDTVVLLPGNSEFHVRDNKSAEQLVAAIRELFELDTAYGITRRFYIFAPLKTLLRPGDHDTIDRATALLHSWAETEERVVILDANPLLSAPDGTPSGNYLRGDGVNLNEHGYLRLSVLLRAQLEADTRGIDKPASDA